MVGLLVRLLAFSPLLIGEHRLTDMDSTIIDDIDLDHLIPHRLTDRSECIAQEHIPHMAQVQRFVGIGAG